MANRIKSIDYSANRSNPPKHFGLRAIQVLMESEKPECINKTTADTVVPFLTKRETV